MEKPEPSDRDPPSLILGQGQHNQDSGSVEATNRRSLVGTACSFLKELKGSHLTWSRRKCRSRLLEKLIRRPLHQRKAMPVSRRMAHKLFGRAYLGMRHKQKLYRPFFRQVTRPGPPFSIPTRAPGQNQSLSGQPRPCLENLYPQTENFRHTYLHESTGEGTGNRKKSLQGAKSKCVNVWFELLGYSHELGLNVEDSLNGMMWNKRVQKGPLTIRPALLDSKAGYMANHNNTATKVSATRENTNLSDGNGRHAPTPAKMALIIFPENNTSLTFKVSRRLKKVNRR
jgi:hypothetical protein